MPSKSDTPIAIHWLRRDLRWQDNTALHHACASELPVLPLFIFDRNILDRLEDKKDARVQFLHDRLSQMKAEAEAHGSSILIYYGTPKAAWEWVCENYEVKAAFTNRDYEPYAQKRDREIYEFLSAKGIPFKGYKDHVVFEKSEVVKNDGLPYTVYTPYAKKWRSHFEATPPEVLPSVLESGSLFRAAPLPMPSLTDMGFERADHIAIPEPELDHQMLLAYGEERNIPSKRSTSRLGIHFRFGTISIREMALIAQKESFSWFNELTWRDFYHQILYHFPHVAERAFRAKYDSIPWRNDPEGFEKWCQGKTGYPMVDAGMRELNATGFMHNRVRMVVASFLTKHLLIDWRWGEAYFAQKLLDFDLAANNGGWQWASGSGCDAAPYFRVFNPTSQLKKFDPQLLYVKQWVTEYGTEAYPEPMVEHAFARKRAIDTYKAALANWQEQNAN